MDAGELRVLARLIATVTIGTVIGSAESDVAKPTADGIEEEPVTATLTDADISTRDAVMRRLEADPEVDASAVGVAARDGTVTLTGQVEWPFQKRVSEKPHRVGWRSRCEFRM
jgi:osmotically-inducible protein OsmY